MGACLRHVKIIVQDRLFFMNFAFNAVKKDEQRKNYPVIHSPVHGKHSGENCSSVPQSVHKIQLLL